MPFFLVCKVVAYTQSVGVAALDAFPHVRLTNFFGNVRGPDSRLVCRFELPHVGRLEVAKFIARNTAPDSCVYPAIRDIGAQRRGHFRLGYAMSQARSPDHLVAEAYKLGAPRLAEQLNKLQFIQFHVSRSFSVVWSSTNKKRPRARAHDPLGRDH